MYKRLIQKLAFPIGFVALIWLIHIIQFFSDIDLRTLGVYPRSIDGLTGILTYPLIHGSWEHLFGNSVSFLILSAILFLFYKRIAVRCFILLYIFSGLGIWIIAPAGSYHIGASGIVYGMVSLVFWSGVFRRNIKSVVLALIILMMYAGYFAGIIPGKDGVSWQGHLMGALVGIALAWIYRKDVEDDEETEVIEEEPEEQEYFLTRDVFEKTLAERRSE